MFEWIKVIGGLAGLAALVWRVVDEFGIYLRISVKAGTPIDGWVTILTTVDNQGNRRKDLSYACLLIGPQDEGPLVSAKVVADAMGHIGQILFTNDLANLRPAQPVYSQGRALIPLTFFYSENIRIGDETLTYRAAIKTVDLKRSTPYAVRFFVFPKGRLHRSTHDCFITGT